MTTQADPKALVPLVHVASFASRGLAFLGAAFLLALTIMTCLSITGRSLTFLGLNQIRGDFEMMELGAGFTIFCFLPWAHFSRGHARVDMFEPFFGRRLNRVLDLFADAIVLAVSIFILWRLWLGMLDKKEFLETTFILQAPVWHAYLAACLGAGIFVFVSAVCLLRSSARLGMK